MKKSEMIKKAGVILFFVLWFFYGCSVYDDYGISWDEGIERDSSLITLERILPQLDDVATGTVNFSGYVEYEEYRDRYYGMAGQLPMAFMEYLNDFEMTYQEIYLMRHFYNFCLFFLASICFYLLCRKIVVRRGFALLGTLLLIASPRILADSFYNIKDLVGLSFVVISSYFGVRFLEKQTVFRAFWLAFFSAVCVNVRIVGGIVPAACLLLFTVMMFREKKGRAGLLWTAGITAVCLAVYYVITPAIWGDMVGGIIKTLETFSNYSTYSLDVEFMGKSYAPGELPWYYLPVWILCTTPVIILLMALAGGLCKLNALVSIVRGGRKWTWRKYSICFLTLTLVIPILYVFVSTPVLYNGWRHFYFIYPVIVFYAVLGMERAAALLDRKKAGLGRVCYLVILCGMLPVFTWISKNHPYEYMFFNLPSRAFAAENLEKDYWAVSQRDALEYICDIDDRDLIKVWTYGPSVCEALLDEEDQNRIIAASDEEADYLVFPHTKVDEGGKPETSFMYEKIYEIQVDQMTICDVYKQKMETFFDSRLSVNMSQNIYRYCIGNIQWEAAKENGRVEWFGTLNQPSKISGAVLKNTEGLLDVTCQVSADGAEWVPISQNMDMEIRYVRFGHAYDESAEESSVTIQFYRWLDEEQSSDVYQPIVGANASANGENGGLALDRSYETRWESGIGQTQGMYFQIQLAQEYRISGIQADYGDSPWDKPTNLRVMTSVNGTDWQECQVIDEEDQGYYYIEPTPCSMIRLVIGEVDSSLANQWSIYEIEVYMDAMLESE